jgi:hypothetical protein
MVDGARFFFKSWYHKVEYEAYGALARQGLWPYFARELISSIAHCPGNFISITRPWLHGESYVPIYWSVFAAQSMRWMQFLRWSARLRMSFSLQRYTDLLDGILPRMKYKIPITLEPEQHVQASDATWVEYLAYEAWWCNLVDEYVSDLKARLRPRSYQPILFRLS